MGAPVKDILQVLPCSSPELVPDPDVVLAAIECRISTHVVGRRSSAYVMRRIASAIRIIVFFVPFNHVVISDKELIMAFVVVTSSDCN